MDVKVYAYDINTGTLITLLSGAYDLTWTVQINGPGSCTFRLPLVDPQSRPINSQILAYAGGPFKLVIDSGGVIVWSGICWTTSYDSAGKSLDCSGSGLLSYYDHVVIAKDYSQATYPAGIYPLDLLNRAITDPAIVNPAASCGITGTVGTAPAAGPPKMIPGYARTQYSTVGQVIADLTMAVTPGAGGIDVAVLDSYNAATGLPTHQLGAWSPRSGRPAGKTGLFVDLAQALDYTWPTDAAQTGNQVIAVGSGTGSVQPVSIQNSGIPIGGLGQPPLLQAVLSYNQIASVSHLAQTARGAAQLIGQTAIVTPTVTVPADYPPAPLGSWIIGDDIRVYTGPDPRFPQGLDQFWRIVAYTVTRPNEGVTTVAFTLNAPPIY